MLEDYKAPQNMKPVFEALFQEYSDVIYRFCLYKTSDQQVAYDLTQDTFLRLWKSMTTGSEIEKPKQYIYQIARNLVIDYYKKSKSLSLDKLTEDGFDPKDTASSPQDLLAELSLLRDAIETLEPDYREVVYLRFVEEMGVEDIANSLDISPNLVSVRINRGKKKLREIFK